MLIAGGLAVVAAGVIGAVMLTGGEDDTTSPPTGSATSGELSAATSIAGDPAPTTASAETTTGSTDDSTTGATTGATTEATDPGTTAATVDATDAPTEVGPNLTVRPVGLDMTVADSPWTPTPCPDGQAMVACIFGGVEVDSETGELTVPFFTEGYTPELEPADYHLHFYFDTVVGGDERKAGSEVAGGDWRLWDGPFPFTSFGGDNGRTGYTLADAEAVGARHLCAIVSDADHRVIPGTGNCAPMPQVWDDAVYGEQAARIEGTFAGRCAIGATLVLPDGWRWVDLVATPVEEAATSLRPTAAQRMAAILTELIDTGGVLWADGPVEGDFIVSLNVVTVEGEFTVDDTPDQIRQAVAQRGITLDGEVTERSLAGRTIVTQVVDRSADQGGQATRYLLPDFGYLIVLNVITPDAGAWADTTDAIARTVVGC